MPVRGHGGSEKTFKKLGKVRIRGFVGHKSRLSASQKEEQISLAKGEKDLKNTKFACVISISVRDDKTTMYIIESCFGGGEKHCFRGELFGEAGGRGTLTKGN